MKLNIGNLKIFIDKGWGKGFRVGLVYSRINNKNGSLQEMSFVSKAKSSALLALGKDRSAKIEATQGMMDDIREHVSTEFNKMAQGEMAHREKFFRLENLRSFWTCTENTIENAVEEDLKPLQTEFQYLKEAADSRGITLIIKPSDGAIRKPVGVTVITYPKRNLELNPLN